MNSALKSRQYAAGYTAWRAMRAKESLPARAEDDALEIGELGRHLGYFVARRLKTLEAGSLENRQEGH